jgi:hypothetical protein
MFVTKKVFMIVAEDSKRMSEERSNKLKYIVVVKTAERQVVI